MVSHGIILRKIILKATDIFGKNPRKGGSPPRENNLVKIAIILVGLEETEESCLMWKV